MKAFPFTDFYIIAIAYKGQPSHLATDRDHDTAMFDTEQRAVEFMEKEYYNDAEYFIIHCTGEMGTVRKNTGGVPWET